MSALYWLVISAVLIIIEIFTIGLTTIWFAAGALMAALLSWIGIGLIGQLLIFIIVSAALLVSTRPLAVKYLNNKTVSTNADSLIGDVGIVEEDIDNIAAKGSVMVRGQQWTARSTSDQILINKGTKVSIKEISGVKLIVTEISEDKEERKC